MKNRLWPILIVVLCGLGVQSPPVQAQRAAPASGWESLGPPGGDVVDLVASPADPSRLYAVIGLNSSQVFTSANSGLSWARLVANLTQSVYSLAIDPTDPNVMYILGNYGLEKSVDGGVTWVRRDFMDYFSGWKGEIAVHPLDHNLILAAGYHLDTTSWSSCIAFLRSIDGGATWSRIQVNPTAYEGQGLGLAVDPSDLNTAYIAGYEKNSSGIVNGKVYKTIDGGSHWADLTGDLITSRIESVVLDPANPARVFAAGPQGIIMSVDGGRTWSRNQLQAFGHKLLLDPRHPNTLCAGWESSVYRSNDGGISWTVQTAARAGSCQSLLLSGGRIFYGSDVGVFESSDAGATWRSSMAGLSATEVLAFDVAASQPGLTYAGVGPGVYKSTDGGVTWVDPPYVFQATRVEQIACDPYDAARLYALVKGCGSG